MDNSTRNTEEQDLASFRVDAISQMRRSSQLELLLHVYIAAGSLMTVGALIYFGFSFLKVDLTINQRMSLMTAGAGAFVTVLSLVMLVYRRKRDTLRAESFRVAELDYDLVTEWSKFESVGRRVLEEKGIKFNSRSPRSIVSTLESNSLIPKDLAREISMALDIRNKVVHQVEPVPHLMVQAAGRILAESNDKLNVALLTPQQSSMNRTVSSGMSDGTSPAPQFFGGGEIAPTDGPTKDLLQEKRKLNLDGD